LARTATEETDFFSRVRASIFNRHKERRIRSKSVSRGFQADQRERSGVAGLHGLIALHFSNLSIYGAAAAAV
jgi:hypothetical protein